LLYDTMILPYLFYCSIAWASCLRTSLLRLHRLQKKAIRTIFCANSRTHCACLLHRLCRLNIFDIYFLQVSQFVYHIIMILYHPHLIVTSLKIVSFIPTIQDHYLIYIAVLPEPIFVPRQLKFKVLNSETLFHERFVIPPPYNHSKNGLRYTFCLNTVVCLKLFYYHDTTSLFIFYVLLLSLPTLWSLSVCK